VDGNYVYHYLSINIHCQVHSAANEILLIRMS
jgi:hypothetical protein